MSITFNEAINSLSQMFPDWDKSALSEILIANDGHVENTIESIIGMQNEDTPSVTSSESQPNNSQSTSQTDLLNTAPIHESHLPSSSPEVVIGRPTVQSNSVAANAIMGRIISSSGEPVSLYRGKRYILPSDFLKVPISVSTSSYPDDVLYSDRELAMMLQNELFQREVEESTGFVFNRNRSQSSSNQNQAQQTQQTETQQRAIQQVHQQTNNSLMKKLATMGTEAKQKMSSIFRGFSSRNSSSNSGDASNPSSRYSTAAGMEMKPLVASDDDDDVEVIDFSTNSPNRKGGRGVHYLDDLSDNTDEVPMISTTGRNNRYN